MATSCCIRQPRNFSPNAILTKGLVGLIYQQLILYAQKFLQPALIKGLVVILTDN